MPVFAWLAGLSERVRVWFRPALDHRNPLGIKGERHAAEHLHRQLGMKILATNVLCPGGELDIVALDGDDLVFVEVRTRASDAYTLPELTVGPQKRRFLTRSARWFVRTRKLHRFRVRFDVIGIVWPDGQDPTLRYYRNAFGYRR